MASKKALLVISEGVEEMEAVITADVLRRAQIDVTIAGLNSEKVVKCSRNVLIVPDTNLSDVNSFESFDALILPGGMNAAKAFAESENIGKLLKQFELSNKVIAVICASPIALAKHEIGLHKRVTSHPSVSNQLSNYAYVEKKVVVDGNLITSRGPGTAFDFALTIVSHLVGQHKVSEITPPMMLN